MDSRQRSPTFSKATLAVFAIVVFALGSTVYAISGAFLPSADIVKHNNSSIFQQAQAQIASTPVGNASMGNAAKKVDLDGVTLTFVAEPETVRAYSPATIKMTVSDTISGAPLTHVDWSVIVKSSSGEETYKSNTLHSHVGNMDLNYAFLEPGENTISVQIASLGPTMMGMDVPEMAQTRILQSGDPMMGWQTDPTFFFGTRQIDFTLNVAERTDADIDDNSLSNSSQQLGDDSDILPASSVQSAPTTTEGNATILNGENGTRVALEFTTNPEDVRAGELATLILNVKRADNGTLVTHPDALVTISDGSTTILQSANAGNPMMPMNGALHGHTGEMALGIVFPEPGTYTINTAVNSLPVSNYVFGNLPPTLFTVTVGESSSNETAATSVTEGASENQVDIVGQFEPYYQPAELTVNTGATVTFTNEDPIMHTATGTDATDEEDSSPVPNDTFDTGLLKMGEKREVTFDQPGTYNYFCTIHPFMRGTITVTS